MHIACPDGDPQYRAGVEAAVAPLLDAGHTFAWHEGAPADVAGWRERAGDADALFLLLHLPADALAALDRLRIVSWAGTGVARFVPLDEAAARGVTVCNVPSYGANAVAEHALALMLAAARGVARGDRLIRGGGWAQHSGRELRGSRLGVVGVGPIGRRMIELGRALGMETVAWTRSPSPQRAAELGTRLVSLEELMATCDVVSVHVAHTPETEGLLSAGLLASLAPHAIVVNTSRGEVIDQRALTQLLDEGRLHGAGLDVFDPEPPPAGDPLLACERAVLTPHVGYDTPTATEELFRITAENVLRFAAGDPVNVVAGPDA